MGASLLMALREKSPRTKLSVWARREEAVRDVLQRGLADSAHTDARSAARDADTVVLCVPVDCMQEIARSIAPHVGRGTLVTDVGSTKKNLTARLEDVFSEHGNFVGSHPMCGSEESGMGAARANLYEDALCIVCPTARTRRELLERTESLWQLVGARTVQMSPQEHDGAAATASHVPHVAAAALVGLVAQAPEAFRALCATGFRDTTRIASGSPGIWTAILLENATKTAESLEKLEKILADYRQAITAGDREEISRLLADAEKTRADIFPKA